MAHAWCWCCRSLCAHGAQSCSISLFFLTEHTGNLEILLLTGFYQLRLTPEMDTISPSTSNDLTHFLSTHQARPCGWTPEFFIAPPVPLHMSVSVQGHVPSTLRPRLLSAVWVFGMTVWDVRHTTFVVSSSELPFAYSFWVSSYLSAASQSITCYFSAPRPCYLLSLAVNLPSYFTGKPGRDFVDLLPWPPLLLPPCTLSSLHISHLRICNPCLEHCVLPLLRC